MNALPKLLFWARALLWITGMPILLLGGTVLWGWITHNDLLIQISPNFAPMQANTAICFTLCGASLLCSWLKKRSLAIATATAVICISGLTLGEYLFEIDLGIDQFFIKHTQANVPLKFIGRIAPNTATCLFLSGFSLIFTALPYQRVRSILSEAFGGIVVSISAIALFGYLTGLSGAIGWSDFTGMALHTSLGLLLLGLGIFHYHALYGLEKEKFSFGPVLGSVFFSIGITLALFQSFKTQQYLTIQNLARNDGAYIADSIDHTINEQFKALRRIVMRWQALNGYTQEIWDIDTDNYLTDLKGLFSIAWYDNNLKLQDYAVKKDNSIADYKDPKVLQLMKEIQQNPFIDKQCDIIIDKNLIVLFPLIGNKNNFQGILATDINLPELIDKSIPDFIAYYYTVEVYANGQLVSKKERAEKGDLPFRVTLNLHKDYADWELRIYPNQNSLALIDQMLPLIVLFTGFTITAFLALAIILIQFTIRSKKQLSAALKDKDEAFAYRQAILDSASFSIISINPKGIIQTFNKAAERMLLWKADEMIGLQSPEAFHDKTEMFQRAEELSKQFNRTLSPGIEVFTMLPQKGLIEEREWTYIRKDGSKFPVLLSITAVKNREGQFTGYVGIAQDISESKKIERMKNELIGITSHELRSPLTSIKGSLDLISKNETLSTEAKSLMDIARSNIDRLVALTNDILDMQKLESGKMEFHYKNIKIKDFITKAILVNQPLAQIKQVHLQGPTIVPDLYIYADEDRLIQVMTNLLANALKYSPQEGTIFIEVTQRDKNVRIAIKDQGPGIPEEFHSILFEKFSQVPTLEPKKKGGTGLGLNISKTIVENHKGSIGFDSSKDGSTFWFELPLTSSLS